MKRHDSVPVRDRLASRFATSLPAVQGNVLFQTAEHPGHGLEGHDPAVRTRRAGQKSVNPGVGADIHHDPGPARGRKEHSRGRALPGRKTSPVKITPDPVVSGRCVAEARAVSDTDRENPRSGKLREDTLRQPPRPRRSEKRPPDKRVLRNRVEQNRLRGITPGFPEDEAAQ
jgi:hypothetical protein